MSETGRQDEIGYCSADRHRRCLHRSRRVAGHQLSSDPTTTIRPALIDSGQRSDTGAAGEIVSEEGTAGILPEEADDQTGPHAPDLCDACALVGPDDLSRADPSTLRVQKIATGSAKGRCAVLFRNRHASRRGDQPGLAAGPRRHGVQAGATAGRERA